MGSNWRPDTGTYFWSSSSKGGNDEYDDEAIDVIFKDLNWSDFDELKCECGADVAKTTHQYYCPKYKEYK